jgi:hypothetical protein
VAGFLANFLGQERHLLAPANAHFMLAVPAPDTCAVLVAVSAMLGWARAMAVTAPQLEHTCEVHGDHAPELNILRGLWRLLGGRTVRVIARRFREPAVLTAMPALEARRGCRPVLCCIPKQIEPFCRANASQASPRSRAARPSPCSPWLLCTTS